MKNIFVLALCSNPSVNWISYLVSFVAALIGGLCTLGGSILTAHLQSKKAKISEKKKEKRVILLEYYDLLNKYSGLINNINGCNIELLRHYVKDLIGEFHKKVYFDYYIGRVWLNSECEEFEKTVQIEVDDTHIADCDYGQKKQKIINYLTEMQNTIMKELEEAAYEKQRKSSR